MLLNVCYSLFDSVFQSMSGRLRSPLIQMMVDLLVFTTSLMQRSSAKSTGCQCGDGHSRSFATDDYLGSNDFCVSVQCDLAISDCL